MPQPLAEGAEEGAALSPLLRRQPGRAEVVRPRQRPQEGRQGARVIAVSPPRQHGERRRGQAEPRPAKPRRPLPRGPHDRLLRPRQLLVQLRLGVEMEPRLVPERVVADLVPRRRDRRQGCAVLLPGRVLANDEEGDPQPPLGQEGQDARHGQVQIGGERLPPGVAVDLEIGPEVVQVQGEAGEGRRAARACHGSRSVPWTPSKRVSRKGLPHNVETPRGEPRWGVSDAAIVGCPHPVAPRAHRGKLESSSPPWRRPSGVSPQGVSTVGLPDRSPLSRHPLRGVVVGEARAVW